MKEVYIRSKGFSGNFKTSETRSKERYQGCAIMTSENNWSSEEFGRDHVRHGASMIEGGTEHDTLRMECLSGAKPASAKR